jgi:hypothetical protein
VKLIMFTGHRDRWANPAELERIAREHGDCIWMHGGAEGFDSQAGEVAARHGIKVLEVVPHYKKYPPRRAPLIRNEQMVDLTAQAEERTLFVLWDGRQSGGTYRTMEYAKQLGVPVVVLQPV